MSERSRLFRDLFGHNLSPGTLYNVNRRSYERLEVTEERIRERMIDSEVVHFDETGIYSDNKRQWLHSASTERLTYYAMDKRRGREAMDRIGILPKYKGTAVHDHWKPYTEYNCQHAFCNAHHLRELAFASEQEGAVWADRMKECLLEIKEAVDRARQEGKSSLEEGILDTFEKKYETILEEGAETYNYNNEEEGKKARRKKSKGENLLNRLMNYKKETLAFMYDLAIPFDNNLVERDVRMIKVKQKISGCFRTEEGARFFCRIRGYLSTIRRHGENVIEAIVFCL